MRSTCIAIVIAVGSLTGCAAPDGESGPPPPSAIAPTTESASRPATVPLDNAKACDLLTRAQLASLRTDEVTPSTSSDGTASPQCTWATLLGGGKTDNAWKAILDTHRSVADLQRTTPDALVTKIGGFPALQSVPRDADSATSCVYAVDVAPNQNLQIYYTNFLGNYPGINHDVACQQAERVATMALTNLRAQPGS